jgi:hypothetical protein
MSFSKRSRRSAAMVRSATSTPKSARISSFSSSSSVEASSLRLVSRPVIAVPSCDEVRLRPPERRFHQLIFCVLSSIARP